MGGGLKMYSMGTRYQYVRTEYFSE